MNNPKPDDFPWLAPYLMVRDIPESLEFYTKAFGFAQKDEPIPTPDGQPGHAEMRYKDMVLMMGRPMENQTCPAVTGNPSPIHLYLYCEDVNAFYEHAAAAGALGEMPPTDMFWGDRMCGLKCINGYMWNFATKVGEFDPSKMPTSCD